MSKINLARTPLSGAALAFGFILSALPARADDAADRQAIAQMRRINGVTPETCASSFAHRLSETRAAFQTQTAYMREYSRAMPWFEAHCRILSELEIAIRKLNDPNSFVCDTGKGRPPGLTPKFVHDHPGPVGVSDFQESLQTDMMCTVDDPVALVNLDMPQAPTIDPSDSEEDKNRVVAAYKQTSAEVLARLTAVACFGKPSKGICAKHEATQ